MEVKRHLARWLQIVTPLRWGLRLGIRLFAPRNQVGAVAAIFNQAGQVLMVEHVFRPGYAWGLPGGWVNRGENPAYTIQREIEEELNLTVQVRKLLLCEPQGGAKDITTPRGLGLAYYCRLSDDDASLRYMEQAPNAFEILSAIWVDPELIEWELRPLQHKAIVLGKQEFDREQLAT